MSKRLGGSIGGLAQSSLALAQQYDGMRNQQGPYTDQFQQMYQQQMGLLGARSQAHQHFEKEAEKGPETNMAWLDRRVDEMRVAL